MTQEEPKSGSPLSTLTIEIPAIESWGVVAEVRATTAGHALGQTMFSPRVKVAGDPLDRSIQLRPLEPSPVPHLAREFMIKTRRRRGMLEDVSVAKFFDSTMMMELAKQDPSLASYF